MVSGACNHRHGTHHRLDIRWAVLDASFAMVTMAAVAETLGKKEAKSRIRSSHLTAEKFLALPVTQCQVIKCAQHSSAWTCLWLQRCRVPHTQNMVSYSEIELW